VYERKRSEKKKTRNRVNTIIEMVYDIGMNKDGSQMYTTQNTTSVAHSREVYSTRRDFGLETRCELNELIPSMSLER
jgi:hypothetical protein